MHRESRRQPSIFLRRFRQFWFLALATLVLWSALAPLAWAQAKRKLGPEETGKEYVLSYALVLLAIGLGLMVVNRANGRTDAPRRRGEEELEGH